MRKILFLILLLLTSATLFAKETEITFWHSLGFHVKEIIEEMVNEYNREHPGIRVKPMFQGLYEEMEIKMLAAAATRKLPDIAQVQYEYMEKYIINGFIEPINNVIPEQDRADIPDLFWNLVTRNGTIYGVPFCVSTTVFFYNENAFIKEGLDPDHPPSTWEEMIEAGKKLTRDTDGDGEIDKYAMMFWVEGLYGLAPFLWGNRGKFFSEDGKRVVLASKEMINTVRMLLDLIFVEKIMPRNWTDWEGGQAFLTGRLAMGFFTSAAISYGEENLPWRLGVAPMPAIKGERFTALSGSALINFASGKKKRRMINDFILWFVNKENTIKIHKEVGYIPVRKSALNSLELKAFNRENPNFKVPIDSLSHALPLPHHPEYFKINEKLREMLQRIILEELEPVEELKRAEAEINAMLE